MPIDPQKLDDLKELLIDQLLSEFRAAKNGEKSIDPRRLTVAQKLLEASDPRAFKPDAAPLASKTTGEVVTFVHPLMKDKAGRDKLRKLPVLAPAVVAALEAFDTEDGSVTPPPTPEKKEND